MSESIVHSLQKIVSELPEKTAIVHSGVEHTYSDLWKEIQACCSVLTEFNVKKGDRVAILLNNSFQYVVSYYGVLAAGGVVVALNTGANANDIQNWLSHCGANILIAETDLLDSCHYSSVTDTDTIVIKLDTKEDVISASFWETKYSSKEPISIANTEIGQVASIIYTSGTTGKPKGVTLSHGNLTTNFKEIIRYLKLKSSDSIVNILPFFYSYGNSILHTHLLSGATLYIENSFMYPGKILQKMSEMHATGFSGVPATFSILLNRTNIGDYNLSSLRYITQAGGAMPVSNIQKIQQLLPEIEIFIMYGQTEATARISYLDPYMLKEKIGSVGKPLDGLDIEIRNQNNLKTNPRDEGELYVSGPSIMLGYWGDGRLTSSVLENGYLKTGDIGYFDEDGYIYLTGRLSDMIKVGGNRISPLEIEEVVSRLDGIEEVAASGVDDEMLGQVVKISVVKSGDSALTEMQIKAYCRQQLALYKIPKFIEFVEFLPKTSSGKVKRYLL